MSDLWAILTQFNVVEIFLNIRRLLHIFGKILKCFLYIGKQRCMIFHAVQIQSYETMQIVQINNGHIYLLKLSK